MVKSLKVATVQPPIPESQNGGIVSHEEMIETGLFLLEKAANENADIICLPEIFNVFGLSIEDSWEKASNEDGLLIKILALCKKYKLYAIYTSLEKDNGSFVISSRIIDRCGNVAGQYLKTHLTFFEREKLKIVPGDDIRVFDTDFGRIGIMICYDCYFPEVAGVLAGKGADIIFYPALQRYFSDTSFEIQTRARSLDNSVFIVRSSYGVSPGIAWKPGIMIGRSCIIDRSGTIIADMGHNSGTLSANIDIGSPLMSEGPGGTGTVNYRDVIKSSRRPELYN